MKTCASCYWWNNSYVRPRCIDYNKALDLDEHSSPIPLEECISHQEQDALMRRNASAEIKAAFGIDKTMLHFSEVKSS